MKKNKQTIEFGDFQTPISLVENMLKILLNRNISPNIIIEPTCGIGNILFLAHESFQPRKSIGVEINLEYCNILDSKIKDREKIVILNKDIFHSINLLEEYLSGQENILFIGNPPWATNSRISSLYGNNLPNKKNFKNLRGITAITGKSNFDISESILLQLIEKFHDTKSIFAFLCKTSVARNVLKYCWEKNYLYSEALLYFINSKKYFFVSVDACFFILDFTNQRNYKRCTIYDSIETQSFVTIYEYYQNLIIFDTENFFAHNYLGKSDYIWRNGIKHDCSKVMELDICREQLINGYGEIVEIERDLLYPLLKASDIANQSTQIRKNVLVTQKNVAEQTSWIEKSFPKTWQYLLKYRKIFDSRKSKIYKGKPLFSIFSVGNYCFKPYKIAVSSLHKKIVFTPLFSTDKPIMLDDTCNFVSFDTEEEMLFIFKLLTSQESITFLNSVIFWDSKRPITVEILNGIDLYKIATTLGLENYYRSVCKNSDRQKQEILF